MCVVVVAARACIFGWRREHGPPRLPTSAAIGFAVCAEVFVLGGSFEFHTAIFIVANKQVAHETAMDDRGIELVALCTVNVDVCDVFVSEFRLVVVRPRIVVGWDVERRLNGSN